MWLLPAASERAGWQLGRLRGWLRYSGRLPVLVTVGVMVCVELAFTNDPRRLAARATHRQLAFDSVTADVDDRADRLTRPSRKQGRDDCGAASLSPPSSEPHALGSEIREREQPVR